MVYSESDCVPKFGRKLPFVDKPGSGAIKYDGWVNVYGFYITVSKPRIIHVYHTL